MARPVPVEQALVSYLSPMVGVGVSTRVPNPRPASFVRVTRIGGSVLSIGQSRVRVLVECWGGTDAAAWALCATAWDAVWDSDEVPEIRPGVEVMDADLEEPVNFPDPASGSARYQFLASLVVNLKE